jgi:hypothetical protein
MNTEFYTDAAGDVCEDLAGCSASGAWVLDGASGVVRAGITDAPSDGRWYVEHVSEYINENLNDERPLPEVIRSAVRDVREHFESLPGGETAEVIERPLAAAAVIRVRDQYVEYCLSADCNLAVLRSSGAVEVFYGDGPRDIDAAVLEEIQRLKREEGLSHSDARDVVRGMIVDGRRQLNQPDGYWALSFDERAIDHARASTLNVDTIDALCLFSDGFERLLELFEAIEYRTLFAKALTNGPDALVKMLRRAEQEDPKCRRYPRVKPSDDASVAFVDLR